MSLWFKRPWKRYQIWVETENQSCSFRWLNYCCVLRKAFGFFNKMPCSEFQLWFSGLRTQLVSMRMWVWSLALMRGLRIWHCLKPQHSSQMRLRSGAAVAVVETGSSDSTPSLGTSMWHRCGPEKTPPKRKKKKPSSLLPFQGGGFMDSCASWAGEVGSWAQGWGQDKESPTCTPKGLKLSWGMRQRI